MSASATAVGRLAREELERSPNWKTRAIKYRMYIDAREEHRADKLLALKTGTTAAAAAEDDRLVSLITKPGTKPLGGDAESMNADVYLVHLWHLPFKFALKRLPILNESGSYYAYNPKEQGPVRLERQWGLPTAYAPSVTTPGTITRRRYETTTSVFGRVGGGGNPDDPVDAPYHAQGAKRHEPWIELLVMELCRLLIQQGICSFLPLLFDYDVEPHCRMTNVNADNRNNDPNSKCLLILSELANSDFDAWFNTRLDVSPRFSTELAVSLFHIMSGLYALWNYAGIVHRDLHEKNLLVLGKTESKQVGWRQVRFRVRIRTKSTDGSRGGALHDVIVWVPDHGMVVTLWDFQFAFRAPGLEAQRHTKHHDYLFREAKSDIVHMRRRENVPVKDLENVQVQEMADTVRLLGHVSSQLRTARATVSPSATNATTLILRLRELAASPRSNLGIMLHGLATEMGWPMVVNRVRGIPTSGDPTTPPLGSLPIVEEVDMTKLVRVPPELCSLRLFYPDRTKTCAATKADREGFLATAGRAVLVAAPVVSPTATVVEVAAAEHPDLDRIAATSMVPTRAASREPVVRIGGGDGGSGRRSRSPSRGR